MKMLFVKKNLSTFKLLVVVFGGALNWWTFLETIYKYFLNKARQLVSDFIFLISNLVLAPSFFGHVFSFGKNMKMIVCLKVKKERYM